MIVVANTVIRELRLDHANRRQLPRGYICMEIRQVAKDSVVLCPPLTERAYVLKVVSPRESRRAQSVPDRGQCGEVERIRKTIGGGRMQEHAIGSRRAEKRAEITIEHGERARQLRMK